MADHRIKMVTLVVAVVGLFVGIAIGDFFVESVLLPGYNTNLEGTTLLAGFLLGYIAGRSSATRAGVLFTAIAAVVIGIALVTFHGVAAM